MRKNTKQRGMVYEELKSRYDHPTPEELYYSIKPKYPKISIATVYRNLRILAEDGKVIEIKSDKNILRYDAKVEPHYHFKCSNCGAVLDLDIPYKSELDEELSKKGYKVDYHSTIFYGLCPNCANK